MINIIITGHGRFSEGMHHALSMIAGDQEHISHVNFIDGMPLEEYQKKLMVAINSGRSGGSQGVLVFTDLKGGTPFNTSMILTEDYTDVRVIYGTNLPLLIESALLSQTSESVSELAETILSGVTDNVGVGDLNIKNNNEQLDTGDGI